MDFRIVRDMNALWADTMKCTLNMRNVKGYV